MRTMVVVFAMLFPLASEAMAGAFQDAQTFGAGQLNQATNGITAGNGNLPSAVPGYSTSTPPQTSLYGNGAALGNAAAGAIANDKTGAGAFVQNSAAVRPQFNITPNDPLIQGAKNIQKNAQTIAGANPTQINSCRNVTTTTPDTYGTFTCTKSRPLVAKTCESVLTVKAITKDYCTLGTILASKNLTGIEVPYQAYPSWTGNVKVEAICSVPGQPTRIKVSGKVAGGPSCDRFKGYRNLGHFFTSAKGIAGPWTDIGSLHYVGWSSYFYCFQAPPIRMKDLGCKKNACAVKFRVEVKKRQVCSDGGSMSRRGFKICCGTFRAGRCHPRCVKWKKLKYGGRVCAAYATVVTRSFYSYFTLNYIRNHSVVTFKDTWTDMPCK